LNRTHCAELLIPNNLGNLNTKVQQSYIWLTCYHPLQLY